MTATDELRRLLDERGVEYMGRGPNLTYWSNWSVVAQLDGERLWLSHYVTPDQAIAATLGRGECEMEPSFTVPSRLDFMQEYRCTECDEYAYLQIATDDDALRFCPNCGAKVVKQ